MSLPLTTDVIRIGGGAPIGMCERCVPGRSKRSRRGLRASDQHSLFGRTESGQRFLAVGLGGGDRAPFVIDPDTQHLRVVAAATAVVREWSDGQSDDIAVLAFGPPLSDAEG